jgi:SOS-response transcriptional repressor LexA
MGILMDWERIIDKIEKYIVQMGGRKADIAKTLGVRPQYLADIKSGKSKNPGSDFTLALINKLNLNPGWMETGEGDVFRTKLNIKDAVLLAKYGVILDEIEKLVLLNKPDSDKIKGLETRLSTLESSVKRLENPAPEKEYPSDEGGGGYTAEPEPDYGESAGPVAYREQIAAGPPIDQSDDEGLVVDVPLRYIKTNLSDYYALRIWGNSMIDAFIPDGSMVLIRKSDTPVDGAIQVVFVDGQATLKRLREGEDRRWTVCYEDGSGRILAMGDGLRVQGDFVAVLPPSTRPRMRGGE